MRYISVKWIHDHSEEPILLLSELDEKDWEVRKVEVSVMVERMLPTPISIAAQRDWVLCLSHH